MTNGNRIKPRRGKGGNVGQQLAFHIGRLLELSHSQRAEAVKFLAGDPYMDTEDLQEFRAIIDQTFVRRATVKKPKRR